MSGGHDMLLSAEHISKNYGDKPLLRDVTFNLREGEKVGLIGINGTGKSTLLKILAGLEDADEGSVSLNPNVKVSVLPQKPAMDDDDTALEVIFKGDGEDFALSAEYEAKSLLTRMNITDFSQKVGTMSGGQRKRVALVKTFVHPADVLILDEPTNHLDSEMVIWLEQKLQKFTGGLIMVTHDRYFLERVVNVITELSHGRLYSYEANYSKYLELKAERLDMEAASERKRQAVLRREYQWIMRGALARGTKSVERIARYEELKNREAPETDATVEMSAASSRLGKKIIELSHVRKSYGGRDVIRDFSYLVGRDDRVDIVGRNGAGKSTLLGMTAGLLAPDSGFVDIGSTVKIGYFTQEGREMDEKQRVYDFVREVASEVRTESGTFSASQMLERFLFPPEAQYSPIGKLSGGERRRLYLLSVLMAAPNVLLLDEPTNDLDVETLAVLEDYLQTFPGAVLAVSHDRWFLDKLASSIFEVRGDGEVRVTNGNFSDYLLVREPDEPAQAEKEKKVYVRHENAPRKLRFSFKEQREFETIDDDIAALEKKIADCARAIEENASDYLRLQELESEKNELDRQLEEKTERWCYLNDLAEKIAAQDGQS